MVDNEGQKYIISLFPTISSEKRVLIVNLKDSRWHATKFIVQKEKHAMGSLVQATKCEDFQ
jgi:hypothetical protein